MLFFEVSKDTVAKVEKDLADPGAFFPQTVFLLQASRTI